MTRLFGALALAVVLAACETAPPVQEMSDARQAIMVAREAGAADLAAAELAEAEEYLQNAEDRLDAHRYREARSAALEAKLRAQQALQLSEASKDRYGD
jgi:predicted S18 family serine protease